MQSAHVLRDFVVLHAYPALFLHQCGCRGDARGRQRTQSSRRHWHCQLLAVPVKLQQHFVIFVGDVAGLQPSYHPRWQRRPPHRQRLPPPVACLPNLKAVFAVRIVDVAAVAQVAFDARDALVAPANNRGHMAAFECRDVISGAHVRKKRKERESSTLPMTGAPAHQRSPSGTCSV